MSEKMKVDFVELKKEILRASGGGIDIIARLFPGKDGFNPSDPKKKFKIRSDDSTPSASASQSKGVWGVRDFGDPAFGDRMKSAIDMWMEHKKLEYTDALMDLASIFTVQVSGGTYQARRPEYEKIKVATRPDPSYLIDKKTKFDKSELVAFNSKIANDEKLAKKFEEVLERFDMHSLVSYTTFDENGNGHIWKSTAAFPIFASQRGEAWKVYKPYELDQQWRFQWFGKKPKGFVFGLAQVKEIFLERKENYHQVLVSEGYSQKDINDLLGRYRMDEIVIASGESDCINFWAYVDVPAICLDSETSKFTSYLYHELREYAKKIYICYDLDDTGNKRAFDICMEFIDIHWIRLPQELKNRSDWRQKICKDFKNWCENYDAWEFRNRLLPVAYPMRFWDYVITEDKNGAIKKLGYQFNPQYAVHHLAHQNYFRYKSTTNKNGFMLIKKDGHVVREINQRENDELKNYMHDFIYTKRLSVDVLNMILRTKQISDSVMKALPWFTESFERASRDSQYWFYNNVAWEINSQGIKTYAPGALNKYVFEDLIVQIPGFNESPVTLQDPYLEIYRDDNGIPRVKILRQNHPFLQYFINISRIHWKSEFDNYNASRGEESKVTWYEKNEKYASLGLNTLFGSSLEPWQRDEQEQAFTNLACIMGYMMHTKFDSARAVACWISDNEERDVTDSKGGTGKSLLGRSLKYFLNTVSFEARKTDIWEDKHMFQNVDENTDMCWFDDAQLGFPFDKIYTAINGFMIIRPQYGKHYELKGDQLPKFFITSNFYPKNILSDDSTRRRIWFGTSSDFYHAKGVEYDRKKDPQFDLGQRIFDDWGPEEWCGFYRIMADMMIGYFKVGQTEPPMRSAIKQMARQQMGPIFFPWADDFLKDKVKLVATAEEITTHSPDNYYKIPTSLVLSAFLHENKTSLGSRRDLWSPGFLKKCMEAWATYHDYTFNPSQVKNASGRVQVKVNTELAEKWNSIAEKIGLSEKDWRIKEREAVECYYLVGLGTNEPEPYQAPF